MTKNWRKKIKLKIVLNIFLIKNWNLQATGKAFSPQERASSTSKKWNLSTFFYVCGSFLLLWIQIHSTRKSTPDRRRKLPHPKDSETWFCTQLTPSWRPGRGLVVDSRWSASWAGRRQPAPCWRRRVWRCTSSAPARWAGPGPADRPGIPAHRTCLSEYMNILIS